MKIKFIENPDKSFQFNRILIIIEGEEVGWIGESLYNSEKSNVELFNEKKDKLIFSKSFNNDKEARKAVKDFLGAEENRKAEFKVRFYLKRFNSPKGRLMGGGCCFYTGKTLEECIIKGMLYSQFITSFTILRGAKQENIKFNDYINSIFGYKKLWTQKELKESNKISR